MDKSYSFPYVWLVVRCDSEYFNALVSTKKIETNNNVEVVGEGDTTITANCSHFVDFTLPYAESGGFGEGG